MNSPFVLVIFGATGDLAKRKLFPAIYSLYKKKQLSEKVYIVGFARRQFTNEEFRLYIEQYLKIDESEKQDWEDFCKNIFYQEGFFDEEKGYLELIGKLNSFDQDLGACITRIFYLATPPDNYETILNFLSSTKLSEGCGQGSSKWTRIAIEKPFGKDLETAQMLDRKLATIFEEKQIFRVDHYLGKETVQNMIAFRFANGIFEPVWNRNYIDHVQITFFEKSGVVTRGKFFDGVGMLRDVAQNHLLQLVASVAMEQPKSFTREAVRDARAEAMQAIRVIKPEEVQDIVVRGQYEGYTQEKNVDPSSQTETFVAMKLGVDTQRFSGVPFYLRAGKAMERDAVEISVVFIQTCHILFKEFGCPEIGNVLTFRIQPDEGIALRVIAKKPGSQLALDTVTMNFNYKDMFGSSGGDAYEKLLMDILVGDQMLFNRSDELESSWQLITNILKGWSKSDASLVSYTLGSKGPQEADALIEKDEKRWL